MCRRQVTGGGRWGTEDDDDDDDDNDDDDMDWRETAAVSSGKDGRKGNMKLDGRQHRKSVIRLQLLFTLILY